MKIYIQGEQRSALCHRDGRVTATFGYRNVPFSDGRGLAENVLVGVCDVCGDVIVIPAQSTPAIAAARQKVESSLEVKIPAPLIDVLDAATTRVASHPTTEFRKQLLVYYVNRYEGGQEKASDLTSIIARHSEFLAGRPPTRRLSMKLNQVTDCRIDRILAKTKMTKTDLIKSLVLKIYDDIVLPDKPKHKKELSRIADAFYA